MGKTKQISENNSYNHKNVITALSVTSMDLNTETLQNQHNTGREMAGLVMLRLGESYEGGVISHFPSYWYFLLFSYIQCQNTFQIRSVTEIH